MEKQRKPPFRQYRGDGIPAHGQHALCDVLEPLLSRSYVHDTYACLKGRGTHRAVIRLLGFMRTNRFLLQLDVRKYFMSIPRQKLLQHLGQRIADPDVLWLCEAAMGEDASVYLTPDMLDVLGDASFHPKAGCGLPIGHLSSQVFGNFYLNRLDHFVKRELKVRSYARYLDDLILLGDRRGQLREWNAKITAFLRDELALELNAKRMRIHPCTAKVLWLGYRVGRDGLTPGSRMLGRLKRSVQRADRNNARPHELRKLKDTLTAYKGLLAPL